MGCGRGERRRAREVATLSAAARLKSLKEQRAAIADRETGPHPLSASGIGPWRREGRARVAGRARSRAACEEGGGGGRAKPSSNDTGKNKNRTCLWPSPLAAVWHSVCVCVLLGAGSSAGSGGREEAGERRAHGGERRERGRRAVGGLSLAPSLSPLRTPPPPLENVKNSRAHLVLKIFSPTARSPGGASANEAILSRRRRRRLEGGFLVCVRASGRGRGRAACVRVRAGVRWWWWR